MTALLTIETGAGSGPQKDHKLTMAIEECRRLGIIILPPDINKSKVGFSVEDEERSFEGRAIRFGLSAIKNVGEAAIAAILAAREVGDFKSLSDFCQRSDAQKVNKKVVESLIKVGGMDAFGGRASMLSALDVIRSRSATVQKQKRNGQGSLFDSYGPSNLGMNVEEKLPIMAEFERSELLALEKELLGFYLTEHPLASALTLLDQECTHKISEASQEEMVKKEVKIGGMVADLRIVITKKASKEMAFVKIEDDTGSIEGVVFPKVFGASREHWVQGKILLVKGRVEMREEEFSLIIDSVSPLSVNGESQKEGKSYDFEVKLPSSVSPRKLVELNRLFKQSQGENKVCLVFVDSAGRTKRMILPYGINYTKELQEEIDEIVGGE